MNPTNSTKSIDSGSKLNAAEDRVTRSIDRFENAIENLAHRVDESGAKFRHAMDLANHSREELMRVKDSAVSSLQPYYERAIEYRKKIAANPRPYIIGVIGLLGGIFLLSYFKDRNERLDTREFSAFDDGQTVMS